LDLRAILRVICVWQRDLRERNGLSNHWTEQVIARVNARLASVFAIKREHAQHASPHAAELIDAIAELTMRGGKRLRSVAVYAGFRCISSAEEQGLERIADVAAAIELLQSYLLIQDDWMDDDDERRGGPSVHVALTRRYGQAKLGASMAILAGDLAMGAAFELLHGAPFPPLRAAEGRAAFDEMHFEVVCGQQLDLLGHADVSLIHHLKTGSYTVRGPVGLGALLADASAAQLTALMQFSRPVGIAFQLRDDLLGTFGDVRSTGKPAGHDLREGKNTALVAEARSLLGDEARARLDAVLGNQAATAAELKEITEILEKCGARARVETRLAERVAEAGRALDGAPLLPDGVAMLRELLSRIIERDR
jgi:geranylgeranyl diphosphate synthase type I